MSSDTPKDPPPAHETTPAAFSRLYTSPNDDVFSNETKSSPLLATTPPTVSKALIRSYPYLLMADFLLGVLTWTNDDPYLNLAFNLGALTLIVYFEPLVTFMGHVIVVFLLFLYFLLIRHVRSEQERQPTLDSIVQVLTRVLVKADLLIAPITALNLTPHDMKRLLFTTVFLSPFYVIAGYYLLSPKLMLAIALAYLLTYHSVYLRVTRRILWKLKTVRLLCFYATGLNFERGTSLVFLNVAAKVRQTNNIASLSHSGKPVRFTYVIYENQRKWIGIGWTANVLNYERAPWTDEFLNETLTPENFTLPDYTEDGEDLVWRWAESNWRLDLTNDGALTLKNPKRTTTVDPGPDEGFVYYDNMWKKPSSEDAFGKFTRRRRWLRTAELVHVSRANETLTLSQGAIFLNDTLNTTSSVSGVLNVQASGVQVSDSEGFKKRRSIRFDTRPTILEEPDGGDVVFEDDSVEKKEPKLESNRKKKKEEEEEEEEENKTKESKDKLNKSNVRKEIDDVTEVD